MSHRGAEGILDYFGIIKRAYYITLKHRFLWIFGLFAGGLATMNMNWSFPSYNPNNSDWVKAWENTNFSNLDFTTFWANYGITFIAILASLLLIMILLFVVSIISQGALIGGVGQIAVGENSEFKKAFKIGWHNFWRVWGVGIIYLLMILISLSIFIIPVSLLVINGLYIIAIVWGILLFFICLAFWLLIGLISPYSYRVVILEKFGVFRSIRESLHFFRDNWKNIVVMYLLLMAIGIGFGIIMALAILIVAGIFLGIGIGLWLASPLATIIYAGVIGLVFVAGLAIISAVYNTFTSSVVTLTYQKLIKRI